MKTSTESTEHDSGNTLGDWSDHTPETAREMNLVIDRQQVKIDALEEELTVSKRRVVLLESIMVLNGVEVLQP